MTRPLRIAVAEDEPDLRDYFQETLAKLGHQVVCIAENGRQLVEQCHDTRPDLVITDIKMPELDGIEAALEIGRDRLIPVILVSGHHDPELIVRAEEDHVLAYLVKPIKKADLETAIAIVMRRFEEFQALQKQTDDLRQALEDRKVIERAKGILMSKAGLAEDVAFRRLQRTASDKNLTLAKIAQMIIVAEDLMAPPREG